MCQVVDINDNNNIHICIAPYGRNFRGAGPGSVLVGVRRGKRVSSGEEKCLELRFKNRDGVTINNCLRKRVPHSRC